MLSASLVGGGRGQVVKQAGRQVTSLCASGYLEKVRKRKAQGCDGWGVRMEKEKEKGVQLSSGGNIYYGRFSKVVMWSFEPSKLLTASVSG